MARRERALERPSAGQRLADELWERLDGLLPGQTYLFTSTQSGAVAHRFRGLGDACIYRSSPTWRHVAAIAAVHVGLLAAIMAVAFAIVGLSQ